MPFPLARWIEDRSSLPHNLGRSGMYGQLRRTVTALRRVPDAEPVELVRRLASLLGVDRRRISLTHGATEANSLALLFLARDLSRSLGRVPNAGFSIPEYPPMLDATRVAGFRTDPELRPDFTALSDPNNPTGLRVERSFLDEAFATRRATLIDETFREFTPSPSWGSVGRPGLWCTGTFTKAYGGDDIRVGWVVAPEESAAEFARFHGLLTDEVPDHSIRSAMSLLRHRTQILAEARGIFRRNRRALGRAVPEARAIAAPLWFDRRGAPGAGDALAHRAAGLGVLVCPGSYFGDDSGVRLTLTQRSFPNDLAVYLQIRNAPAS
ncbi:MAG: aminotransferase class I/II-fold pyridoxal phosphate-dependent enzyme [Thermoplasmata archaeon]|nr:aminotransferase class I/II-fold pyridoxal phosphate-dependent enzyme [Thermoplasmata archaeon]